VVDGKPAFSCLVPIVALQARRVTTLEGLGTVEDPGPLQRAFIEEQAVQCGFCIPGMIMRAHALLQSKAAPSDHEIREHMKPNLCRCGTQMRILAAVRRAADAMRAAGTKADDQGAGR
jgi:aerobic-type carbon monoxide dehydrogenase small subunit (CoxS/CutS family)